MNTFGTIPAAIIANEGNSDRRATIIADTFERLACGRFGFTQPFFTDGTALDIRERIGEAIREGAQLILVCTGDLPAPSSAIGGALDDQFKLHGKPDGLLVAHLERAAIPLTSHTLTPYQEAVKLAWLPREARRIFGTNGAFAYRIALLEGQTLVALPGDPAALPFVLPRVIDAIAHSGLFPKPGLRTLWLPDDGGGITHAFSAVAVAMTGQRPAPDYGGAEQRLGFVGTPEEYAALYAFLNMDPRTGTRLLSAPPPKCVARLLGHRGAVIDLGATGGDFTTHVGTSKAPELEIVRIDGPDAVPPRYAIRPPIADLATDPLPQLARLVGATYRAAWTIAMRARGADTVDVAVVRSGRCEREESIGLPPGLTEYDRRAFVLARAAEALLGTVAPPAETSS